jgi:hypothetical protein
MITAKIILKKAVKIGTNRLPLKKDKAIGNSVLLQHIPTINSVKQNYQ